MLVDGAVICHRSPVGGHTARRRVAPRIIRVLSQPKVPSASKPRIGPRTVRLGQAYSRSPAVGHAGPSRLKHGMNASQRSSDSLERAHPASSCGRRPVELLLSCAGAAPSREAALQRAVPDWCGRPLSHLNWARSASLSKGSCGQRTLGPRSTSTRAITCFRHKSRGGSLSESFVNRSPPLHDLLRTLVMPVGEWIPEQA